MWSGDDIYFMKLALEEAYQADKLDEVPIGAVLVQDGQLLAAGHNCPVSSHDPSAHAEMIALRHAAARHGRDHQSLRPGSPKSLYHRNGTGRRSELVSIGTQRPRDTHAVAAPELVEALGGGRGCFAHRDFSGTLVDEECGGSGEAR